MLSDTLAAVYVRSVAKEILMSTVSVLVAGCRTTVAQSDAVTGAVDTAARLSAKSLMPFRVLVFG